MKVTYKRHIVKSITYRFLGTFQTCIISYILTDNFWVAGSIGLTEMILKPFMYFLHERVWYKFLKFGLKHEIKK